MQRYIPLTKNERESYISVIEGIANTIVVGYRSNDSFAEMDNVVTIPLYMTGSMARRLYLLKNNYDLTWADLNAIYASDYDYHAVEFDIPSIKPFGYSDEVTEKKNVLHTTELYEFIKTKNPHKILKWGKPDADVIGRDRIGKQVLQTVYSKDGILERFPALNYHIAKLKSHRISNGMTEDFKELKTQEILLTVHPYTVLTRLEKSLEEATYDEFIAACDIPHDINSSCFAYYAGQVFDKRYIKTENVYDDYVLPYGFGNISTFARIKKYIEYGSNFDYENFKTSLKYLHTLLHTYGMASVHHNNFLVGSCENHKNFGDMSINHNRSKNVIAGGDSDRHVHEYMSAHTTAIDYTKSEEFKRCVAEKHMTSEYIEDMVKCVLTEHRDDRIDDNTIRHFNTIISVAGADSTNAEYYDEPAFVKGLDPMIFANMIYRIANNISRRYTVIAEESIDHKMESRIYVRSSQKDHQPVLFYGEPDGQFVLQFGKYRLHFPMHVLVFLALNVKSTYTLMSYDFVKQLTDYIVSREGRDTKNSNGETINDVINTAIKQCTNEAKKKLYADMLMFCNTSDDYTMYEYARLWIENDFPKPDRIYNELFEMFKLVTNLIKDVTFFTDKGEKFSASEFGLYGYELSSVFIHIGTCAMRMIAERKLEPIMELAGVQIDGQ